MGNVIVSNITRTPVENGSNWGSVAGLTPPPSGDVVYPLTYADRTKTVTVGATGSGDGSIGSPWTLEQAMSTAVAGDVVGIEEGVYTGAGSTSRNKPVWRPTNSGTLADPIVFIAENLAYNRTTGYTELRSGNTSFVNSYGGTFGAFQEDHIHWVGIYSDMASANNFTGNDCGSSTFWECDNGIIANCKIIGDNNGWESGDNMSGVRLEDTLDVQLYGNFIKGYTSGPNFAAVITYRTADPEIHHNTLVECGNGIQPKGSTGGDYLGAQQQSGFQVYNNLVDTCSYLFKIYALNDGPSNTSVNNIHNNICINTAALIGNTSASTAVWPNPYKVRVFNNVLDSTGTGVKTGTVDMAWDWITATAGQQTPPLDNDIFNNIIINSSYYASINWQASNTPDLLTQWADWDYNCQYNNTNGIDVNGGSNLTWAQWQALGEDVNSTDTDPQFVSATDYHLQAGVPARTAGNDIYNYYGGGAGATIPQGAYVTGTEQIGTGVAY